MAKPGATSEVEKARVGKGYKIAFCGCEHPYQDKRYGKNNRVFTTGPKRQTCTVCGKSQGT